MTSKGAEQLSGNCAAIMCLCFRYIHVDSTIPLPPKSEISTIYPSSVVVQPGLCRTWSETPETDFLMTHVIMAVTKH